MKNFFLTIVVFSVLLFIGCQDNSIVDPIPETELEKTYNPLVNQGIFELRRILVFPGSFQSYYLIEGQINYTHELMLLDPQPPAPQHYVSLSLNVNADVRDPYSPTDPIWTITSTSEDMIYVSEDGIYLLEKYFTIQGREDGMLLMCRFLVTTDGVGLNEMWLVVPEENIQLADLYKSNDNDPQTLPPVKRNVLGIE
jgi:hypothetical protein